MAHQAQSSTTFRTFSPLLMRTVDAAPPHAWFGVSAVFHYLGPSFAVLLFPAVGVAGVAWFRIAAAAFIFTPFTKPWHTFRKAHNMERLLLLALGCTLAAMNCAFYFALDRLQSRLSRQSNS